MKISLGAGIAAVIAGAALAATPVLAQMHGGGGHFGGGGHIGGGGHFGGGGFRAGSGFHGAGVRGPARPGGLIRPGAGAWHGGWRDHDHDHDHFFFGGFFWPGWGFYDPFLWDTGYVGGYAVTPYEDGYSDSPYDAGYPDASAPGGAPAGYDCDGWRWDATAGRYVAAKVSCN